MCGTPKYIGLKRFEETKIKEKVVSKLPGEDTKKV